jgi:signal-transduction protein with cAMP-binding, CBS, and nucleotidyltransferase domain/predicted metal-dependent phosphoesterase TrpH/PAS domain-containing protein
MSETVLVNFHSHTIFSDGELTPEILAGNMASAGVRYAALTDHDSIEGLQRFQDALKKRGIAFLSGVELTTQLDGREAHLLGYGFAPEHAELSATLLSLRQVRGMEVHSIADSLRKAGSGRQNDSENAQVVSAAPHGILEIGEAIALIHRAGGRAFWAHPLVFEPDLGPLDVLTARLKAMGIDGIEGIYAPFTAVEQNKLRSLAQKYDLLLCAGTDVHGNNGPGSSVYAIEMSREDWTMFRQAVISSPAFIPDASSDQGAVSTSRISSTTPIGKVHHFRRRFFIFRIFLPTLFAIGLFLAALWGLVLPSFEQTLLDRKRELIRELTNSAWSILNSYQRDELNGILTRDQAQKQAAARIEALRYGPEGKDYFWIQDMQPRMIMHPYRSDLNGQELYNFTDPRGVPIFVQFADLVRRQGEGYIDYVWQWKDDPQRLEPKESYVKGYEPWGWVIGTGIYTDDVHDEIARIEQRIINTSVVISGVVILLLLFVLQQSLRIERERQEVVDNMRESTDRYHTLVEATTEGTLLVVDDRCRYANPTFLNMLRYTMPQLEFLELEDLLPREACNGAIWDRFRPGGSDEQHAPGQALEGCLMRNDGSMLECILTLNPMQYSGQRGFILLAKDVARRTLDTNDDGLALTMQSVPIGIFRARAARRGVFLDINEPGRALLPYLAVVEKSQPALADFFSDPAEYEQVFQSLILSGEVKHHILHVETSDAAARFISLTAHLIRDEAHQPAYIAGLLEDITTARKQEAGREALIDKLQASLLFLHEPLANLGREIVLCRMDTTIEELARMMTERKVTAALVANEAMMAIGIVTDHDLRARVLAENVNLHTPVSSIMSAPLTKISERALIYEALMRMEEKGVRHLAVEDQNGQIVSVIDSKSLIQFQRYGPIVLSREISRSKSPVEVAQNCERITPLVKTLLDSSARPRHVTNMLASICDAATERLIQLAVDELGPPPARFAFIGMGSQGRQEQTLLTDQDNGIIFASDTNANPDQVSEYFLRLGSRVCEGLNRAGYPLCRGHVMANNPRWCRSLPDWITSFNEWVQRSEPQEIIDISIFFDFRTVYGDAELTHELRQHIHSALVNQPAFFHHFAENALMFKPPFRLLGNIYLTGGATEHSGEINLKDAMMPMVSFARLYALHHQITQTHTLERIEALTERNIIQSSSRDEIMAAYDFLMQLRLQTQIAAIETGRPALNIIHPSKLGYIQKELLKQAFAQIAAVQKKISYDFLGGV